MDRADDIAAAARHLRSVLDAIERGELEATAQQAAYLSGAADALETLANG